MDSFLYCVALVSFVPMPLIFIASIYPRKKKSPARTLVQKGMHLIKNVLSLYHYLYIVLPWHLVSYLFYKKHVIKALQKAMRYIQKKQVHKAILHYKKGLKHLSIGNPLLAPLVVICQHIGKLLCDEGKDLKAAHHYKEAILFNKNCNVLSPPALVKMHDHLGNLYCVRQRFQQAIHHYKKKIHLQKRNNYKPQKIALAYHTLGMLFFLQKNYTRSLLFLYRAKKAVKVYGCTEKLILADIYMGLARIFAIKKAGSRCILHYKSHLREQRKHGMDKYVNMLGGYNCLRDILQGKKAYTQTITSYKNLLAISLKYFHAKSLKIALIYVHLGDMYYAQRHYTPAIRYYIKALNILKKSKNISLFALTSAYRNIAYAFLYAAKYEKALYHAKRKQEIEEKHLPKQDEFKSFTHLLIGTIHEEKSDYHSALNHYLKALESFIYTSGLHHRNLIDVYEKISRVYMYFQAWEEAIHYRKQALHLAKKHLGEYHFRIALNTRVLGFLYSRQDDMPQALKHYHEALHILTKLNMFPQIRAMYERIADIYYNQTNYSEAIGYYKTLATLYRKKDHLIPALVTCYTKMGSAYSRLGIFPKAIALYKKAHHVSFNALGKNHLTTHSTKAVLDLLKMKKAV